jgi:hypothetical protein
VDQDPGDPQSWNLYAYARNNPLRYVDPTGRKCVTTDDGREVDDGTGGGCEAAGVDPSGKIKPQTVEVRDVEPPSPELLAVALGIQQAAPVVEAAAIGAAVVTTAGLGAAVLTGSGLTTLGLGTGTAASTASTGVLLLSEEAFNGALAAERFGTALALAGFKVFGSHGLVGNSYNINVFLIEAMRKAGAPLRGLVTALEGLAKSAGASQLRIVGTSVRNPGFLNPQVAQRYGFTFRQINGSTIELVKNVR